MFIAFDPVVPLVGVDHFSGVGTYAKARFYKDISIAYTFRAGKDLMLIEVLHSHPMLYF